MRHLPFISATNPLIQLIRKFLALLAAFFYGFGHKKLKLIGITGTNGKTTTTYLIHHILEANNYQTGIIGTTGYLIKEDYKINPPAVGVAPVTTPEPFLLHKLLMIMVRSKTRYCVIEATSFGLRDQRTYGLNFSCAVLTNFSYCHHVSVHGSMEKYLAAKLRLFQQLSPQATAILPLDDPYFSRFRAVTKAKIITYGFNPQADIWAEIQEERMNYTRTLIHTPQGSFVLNLPLIGHFNVLNALAAIGAGIVFNITKETIKRGLESVQPISGRWEIILGPQPFSVIIDKANTPKAFESIIEIIRKFRTKRAIVVYGTFYEFPLVQREKLAEITTDFFDLVIITIDDPGKENPEKGINDFLNYVKKRGIDPKKYLAIMDREEAIRRALQTAGKGDVIVILGRGDEKFMNLGNKVIEFDDREVAKRILQEMGY